MNFRIPAPHLHFPSKRFFLWLILGLLAVLALAAGSVALLLESDYFQRKLTQTGSTRLGRELVIKGPLDIDWKWRNTTVHAEDIHLANAPGLQEPDMLTIGTLDFTIRPLKLLFGRLELPEIRMTKPTLVLEKTDENTKNWDLPAFSSSNVAANAALPKERGDFPIIGKISITDGAMIYRDRLKELDMNLKLETATGSGTGKDEPFTLSGKGTLSDKPFTVDATGGSLAHLRDSSKPYPLKADIVMGPTVAHVNGTFKDPLKMDGVDAALNLKGENLADLYYLTGIPFPPTPVYSLQGRIVEDGDVWKFDIAQGKVGNSDVKANGTYNVRGERGFLKADIQSAVMNLDDLGGFIGLRSVGKETVAPRNRFFPDVPINLTRLRNSDLDVSLKASKLNAPGWPLQSLDVRFNLDHGVLKIDPLQAGIANGTMTGDLTLDGRKDIPHVSTDVKLRRMSLREFFGDTKFEGLSGGRFGGRIAIEGDGKSLADVMGTADGRISLLMAGGQISLTLVEGAGLDIAELAPLIFGDDKTTRIRCAIGDFHVSNGQLGSDVFLFDTSDTNIEGKADINLKTETIDAEVEAHPKDMSPLTARTPITIKGPLKKPGIGINPGPLAAKGAAATALAFIAPIAAFLPFIDTGGGEDADCRALIRGVRARHGDAIPGPTPAEAPAKVK